MTDDVRASYPEAVAALCDWGWPQSRRDVEDWPDFRSFGLSDEHIPDLIRMAIDPVLNTMSPDSGEVWAPFHACQALGQLGAVEAAGPMLQLLDDYQGDDYLHEEMPHVMAALGPEVIPTIAEFVGDESKELFARIFALDGLEQIGKRYPEAKLGCVAALERQLAHYPTNGETLNAGLVSNLAELKGTDAIETIQAAFAADAVDITVYGDLEDVEIAMGLRLVRETPRPRYGLFRDPGQRAFRQNEENGEFVSKPASGQAVNEFRNVGRNDPCPCGSGRKFKKCCLERA